MDWPAFKTDAIDDRHRPVKIERPQVVREHSNFSKLTKSPFVRNKNGGLEIGYHDRLDSRGYKDEPRADVNYAILSGEEPLRLIRNQEDGEFDIVAQERD